jgi:hypothetical protein
MESVKKLASDRFVAVGEHVRLDDELLAEGALDGIASAVDLRTDRLDDDACGWIFIQA